MTKVEFEIVEKGKDVKLHFGKYNQWTAKEIIDYAANGLSYIRWLYRKHTRLPDDARDVIKQIYNENKKEYPHKETDFQSIFDKSAYEFEV